MYYAQRRPKTIIGDLRYELEDKEITLRFKRVQHYDAVKIGCVCGIMDKKHLQNEKIV